MWRRLKLNRREWRDAPCRYNPLLQILGRGDEIVKHILLLIEHAGAMPVFAELAAAAQVRDRENAVVIEPGK